MTNTPRAHYRTDHALGTLIHGEVLRRLNNVDNAHDALDEIALRRDIAATLLQAEDYLVRQARQDGASWTDIGNALGMTRQAAQQRHGRYTG